MYQTAILENSTVKTKNFLPVRTITELEIEERIEPQNVFLAGSVAEQAEVYAEAATFVLFLVLILAAVSMMIYGVMETANNLYEFEQAFRFFSAEEI